MKKFLVVGLGNIGADYVNTRHNIGFDVVDKIANEFSETFSTDRLGETTVIKHKGRTINILKPSTFMNLSGKAILFHLTKNKIPIENLLVITDDLNLDYGKLRLRAKGSPGGHNGLKNTELLLGTNKYPRLRFGVGDSFSRGNQVDFVLGKWSDDEKIDLSLKIDKAAKAALSFCTIGIAHTMNEFNG